MAATSWAALDAVNLAADVVTLAAQVAVVIHLAPVDLVAAVNDYLVAAISWVNSAAQVVDVATPAAVVTRLAQVAVAMLAVQLHLPVETMAAQLGLGWA